jgi:hypothetical protein
MSGRSFRPFLRPRSRAGMRRWLAIGVLGFVGFLYYQPLRSYLETR